MKTLLHFEILNLGLENIIEGSLPEYIKIGSSVFFDNKFGSKEHLLNSPSGPYKIREIENHFETKSGVCILRIKINLIPEFEWPEGGLEEWPNCPKVVVHFPV